MSKSQLSETQAFFGTDEDLAYLPSDFLEQLPLYRERVLANARSYFPEMMGEISIREMDTSYTSSYPILRFEVGNDRLEKEVFLKFPRVTDVRNEARNEFENMTRVNAYLGGNKAYGCARPLDFWSDVNGLLTEKAPGDSFHEYVIRKNRLTSGRSDKSELILAIQKCGKCLRAYHESSGIENRSVDDKELERAEKNLSRIGKSDFSNRFILQLRAVCDPILSDLSATKKYLPHAVTYGDIALGNMLYDGNRLTILDVEHTSNRPILVDIGRMLTALETAWHLPRYLTYNMRQARKLQYIWLQSYGFEDDFDRYRDELILFWLAEMAFRYHNQSKTLANQLPSRLLPLGKYYLATKFRKIISRKLKPESFF